MDAARQAALEARGWATGDVQDFLDLSDEEMRMIDFRIALGDRIKARREAAGLTQAQLGKRIGSGQARIAKAETGTFDVSLDLMFRAFFATGGTLAELVPPAAGGSRRRPGPDAQAVSPRGARTRRARR
jgi:DNA-binding XRE family transcriptional regulator